ncbi:recombinase family protein [Actinoplanes sp. NPDC004185]
MAAWLRRPPAQLRTRGQQQARHAEPGLRFAFYGRTSTGRFQDPASSREWQRADAIRVISGRGRIVVEFFDIGYSRALAWHHRPQAAALLDAAADADRGFDAVVIGEFERGFTAGQARSIIAQLHAYGISVWLAEINGPVDLTDATHQALLLLLGHHAEREILRARRRTTAAMCAQVRTQGRHLGGRPPYGYRMADAGPHPNPQHSRWGRRLLRLEPDPETAPHVEWIFQQRLAGLSTAGIARSLNALGIPPPSAHDPARNPHRSGTAWTLRTVAAILANPRYTGRQVWNRQHTDHHELRPGDKSSRPPGVKPSRGWNHREQWEVSPPGAHSALVSEAAFVAAQQITALAVPDDANPHRYQLTGLVICGLCGRRAEGHWAHGRARYRCRHGYTSASASDAQPNRMKTLYVREDQALAEAGGQLARHLGTTWDAIPISGVAGQLRSRGIAIVCTPVSINLDTGPVEIAGQDNLDALDVTDTGQLSLLGISIPQARQAIKNPQPDHPPKRE